MRAIFAGEGKAAWSTDGNAWTEVTVPGAGNPGITGAAQYAGVWVLTGNTSTSQMSWRSTDGGLTWAQVALPGENGFGARVAVSGDGSVWIAVGMSGAIWRSTDAAQSWTLLGTGYGFSTYRLSYVAWIGTRFLAVGEHGSRTYSNAAGTAWTAKHSGTDDFIGIASNGSRTITSPFLTAAVIVSDDQGVTWSGTYSVGISAVVRDLAWTGQEFAAMVATGPDSPRQQKPVSVSTTGTSFVPGGEIPGTVGARQTLGWVNGGFIVQNGFNQLIRSDTAGNGWTFGQTLTFAAGAFAVELNRAPNAPTLTSPATGSTIDRNATARFALTPSDPDPGDSTSKTDWRYRLIGAPTWTDASQALPLTYIDFPAGTFAAGDYEWQARTYDSQGAVGPYSTSSFFTAATAPAGATFTDPVNGQTIGTATYTATISAPNVDASQWRTVADNAGTPDAGTVYQDSGVIESTTLRSYTFNFPVNNRTEHLQARIRNGGLWSQWADSTNPISYTQPPDPTATVTPVSLVAGQKPHALRVDITNPTPGAGEPAVAYNNVYVSAPDFPEERLGTLIPANGSWTFHTPRSEGVYTFRVEAVATNGTTSETVVS